MPKGLGRGYFFGGRRGSLNLPSGDLWIRTFCTFHRMAGCAAILAHNLVYAANLDFIPSYRPLTNVVERPTRGVGRGYSLTGHHEILVPLFAGAVLAKIGAAAPASVSETGR